jgi:predicted acyl esterase
MAVHVETLEPAPLDPSAEQVMVRMRDGVHLATDVYVPDGPGPHPVVLVRLPYDKCGRYTFMPLLAPHFTERGYAFVAQDVRGKYRSEGEVFPFVHEVDDGYDTIDWLAAQTWCDGTVGMFGDSYFGFTQWAAVASGHPALRAIVPRVTGADLANLVAWTGAGVPALYGYDYLAECWADKLIHDFTLDLSHRPLAELFDEAFAAIGARSAAFDAEMRREAGMGGAIDPFPMGHPFTRVDIPVLHSAGWFDNIAFASMHDYTALSSQADRAHLQYLIVDSTDHENYHLGDVPIGAEFDHDLSEAALERMIPIYLGPALDFFDVFLRGIGDAASIPRVRWHHGNDGWRTSPTWPPAGVRELKLFLADGESARRGPGGGALAPSAPPAATSAHWTHDPSDLVPSTVENSFAFLYEYPDEREVEGRDDVVTFTSAPVSEPLDIAGPVAARLRLATTGPSMHVFVKLLDVAPDGAAHMLLRGQIQVDGPDSHELVTVDLNHLGYRLLPGHSLRLHVASSDFPLYVPHPGTGDNPWFATETATNAQTLFCGGEESSCLVLTVLGPQ